MLGQRILTSLLVAAALQPALVGAQVGNVQEGARVRLRAISGGTAAGILMSSPKDSVFINGTTDGAYPAVQKFALQNVATVDVSIGQHGNLVPGILIGGVAGGGMAYLLARLGRDDDTPRSLGDALVTTVDHIAGGMAVYAGGLFGAILGGVIGHAQKSDTWQPIDLTATAPQLTMKRMHGGRTGVGLSFAFGGASPR